MDQTGQKYLIGRQPILNRDEQICAYELLFRSADSLSSANVSDASQATASVILNTLAGFGIQQILGNHQGFINLELDILMSDSLELLPKDMVVLELLETLEVTPELIERCRELKEAGFYWPWMITTMTRSTKSCTRLSKSSRSI